jgi:hypothetical protein
MRLTLLVVVLSVGCASVDDRGGLTGAAPPAGEPDAGTPVVTPPATPSPDAAPATPSPDAAPAPAIDAQPALTPDAAPALDAAVPAPDGPAPAADLQPAAPDLLAPDLGLPAGVVAGRVSGLGSGKATVILGSDGFMASQLTDATGAYRFTGIAAGTYFLKVEAPGKVTGPARAVRVGGAGTQAIEGPLAASAGPIDFQVTDLPPGGFRFHWEEDVSRAGYEESAHVNQPPKIEFLKEPVDLPDLAAADTLVAQFNVLLSDQGTRWNQEYAYRLLETMRTIPQPSRKNAGEAALVPSKWILTDQHLDGDVSLAHGADGTVVIISVDAFVYARPRLVLLDGERGRFFSKRLHHAVVRYVTRDGQDLAAAEKILQERFGCSTKIPDYAALTAPTTKEDAAHFQPFHPAELLQLIDTFEEMPDGYHKVPGLKYLVRRKDGQPHPLYPAAPAVAWAWPQSFPNGSYIEFMDSGFTADPDDTHRLIVHEKAHFLWGYVFSEALKKDWIALGGWYPNPADPDGWSTSKTTEFVSAYAHKKNPDEDMAESLAHFVLNPALLQSRAPGKFELIRDRIMHGTRFLAQVQKDLTFEVLNLYPDYTYPGKIKRVDISVEGAPDADKKVTVELALHTADKVFAGASRAYFRLYSSINTFQDMYVYPVDGTGAVLRGTITISKFAKSGYWMTDQIIVTDQVGNQRLEGVNDYGWKLFLDNPGEDVTKPRYVPGTLVVERKDETVTAAGASHAVQKVLVRWRVEEDRKMDRVYAKLSNPSDLGAYPLEAYGTFDAATSTAEVAFTITEFMSSGDYGVPYLMMYDAASNLGDQNFSSSPQHQPLVSLPITTTNHDAEAPTVSLNDEAGQGLHRILISARPTDPAHPNGETLVTIKYQARDDRSGLDAVSYRLLDPQGISHPQYHYHPNFYTLFFEGNPTAWAEYQIDVVLPVGSPPGTWGLQQLVVRDKARNQRLYNFVELLQFKVGD